MPTMSPPDRAGDGAPPTRRRAGRTGWTIEVSGVRAEPPRVRERKVYRFSGLSYTEAADEAWLRAAEAGLRHVVIVGVTLGGAPEPDDGVN